MSDWRSLLRPASFAGSGFYVKMAKAKGGQRLIVQEIPLATATLENQGLLPKIFTITAYFLGDGWLAQRESFLTLLDSSTGPQTLVLPTKGPLTVQTGAYSYQDDETIGAYGEIEIEFTLAPGGAAPFANSDTASALLNTINELTAQIGAAYAAVMGPIAQAGAVAEYAATLLGSAGAAVLALPAGLLAGVSGLFAAAPGNAAATAATVTSALLTVSDNAVSQVNPAAMPSDAVAGIVLASPMAADPSMGIAALAGWGVALPAPALYPPSLAQAQAAVVALVQQSAGLGLAALYAQTVFGNAATAVAARAQLSGVMDTIAAAIANAGQPDMYRAWTALTALAVTDMIARAQSLPSLGAYSFPVQLPDVVVAQILAQDATQGAAIAALNDALHPLFLPASGLWLEAA